MSAIEQQNSVKLVCKTRVSIELSQVKFAAKLGVSLQSVNRWENGRTKPLAVALKQIEELLQPMGNHGKDLLVKYFGKLRNRDL
ncbi:helix-turn-helix transcriptional regulator [Fischerella sp. JS2]|uniref:helix-turn-helix domain-containing protein n=1 Tax=Fischerella sp. JS2 TaxID=2597771 RepID=UPI0028E32C10|nr:helix-turn-helix transcriptional regulator [Fischerella sp. JS2]